MLHDKAFTNRWPMPSSGKKLKDLFSQGFQIMPVRWFAEAARAILFAARTVCSEP
jgi:hypothetical protein